MYQKKRTKEYLNRIDYLSVREIAGQRIIKELTGRDSFIALDPTLMFDQDEWSGFFPDNTIIDEPYVFAYFLGNNENSRSIVREFSGNKGLKIVTCPHLDQFVPCDVTFGDVQLYELDPIGFLNLIRGAEYVLTDSFHGSVFSLIYHKQFAVFGRFAKDTTISTNNRINSLLSLLNLGDRLCHSIKELNKAMNCEIDYNKVDADIRALRENTFGFIEKALSIKEER